MDENENYEIFQDEYSLESILAEFKGSAYITGDKRTPPDVLEERAQEIVHETLRGSDEEQAPEKETASEQTDASSEGVAASESPVSDGKAQTAPVDEAEKVAVSGFEDTAARAAPVAYAEKEPETGADIVESVMKRIAEEEQREERERLRKERADARRAELREVRRREREKKKIRLLETEETYQEPDLLQESHRFARGISSMTLRAAASFIICFFMAVITFSYESGGRIALGIGQNTELGAGILLLLQLVVMLLCVDVLIDGVMDCVHAAPGAESLIAAACLVSGLDACIRSVRGGMTELPFCLVTATSLPFALVGRSLWRRSMCDALRVAGHAKLPFGVFSDFSTINDRAILKKTPAYTEKFFLNLSSADASETVYGFYAPLAAAASVVFALIASLLRKETGTFIYSMAGIISVAASFTALTACSVPFRIVSKRLRRAGSAVAGWSGACEIFDSDGALVTDNDVFPSGKVAMTGIKLFEGASSQKIIANTASLVIASGSGISPIFSELLRSQGLSLERVEDFCCYEGGGVGGVVRGEKMLVGSAGFMKLMGIRIPEKVNLGSSVFSACSGVLTGVFTLEYTPANSVRSALNAMINTGMSMLLAIRDFNVTPQMLQQKFRISLDDVEYIPIQECYRISAETAQGGSDTVAVVTRPGLGPFAEIIMNARRMKTASEIASAISVMSSVLGMLIMFLACRAGSLDSASAGNVFLYMLLVQVITLLSSFIICRAS